MYQPEHEGKPETFMDDKIKLPKPVFKSNLSIEEAIHQRRSARSYKDLPMTLGEVSQLLWSAQGITDPEQRYRTAPSAGALYPLEVYAVISNVMDVSAGVYHYKPFAHRLEKVKDGNMINELAKAALSQTSIIESAMTLVMTGVYERTTKKYDERGIRYVYMEAGHAAQNIYLQAESLELGLVVIGAFNDKEIGTILNLPEDERPLYIIPVGKL
ncbi:MAG: SagB/ThcOx family dehydrogenase [Bacteroidia bacterium]|nr:SagB/ThcOx family dehydrogenase [Bacteroidia bacterium]